MSQELLIILVAIISGFSILYYLLSKKSQSPTSDKTLTEWLKSMQGSIDETNKTLNQSMRNTSLEMTQTLQENNKQINDRLTKAAEVIRDVSREVGQMSEIGRSMKELQEFLKSPKLRGNIGEEVLKDLISQTFPKNSFNLQYQFRSGEKVDAAIKTDAGILPIDSKFPMENFQKMTKAENATEKDSYKREFIRDVKKHIDSISKKYILPEEGTMDFCLMYIPSEPVYYEIANDASLLDYARRMRVYAVSPTTLYAHLQVILLSFEGKKIESKSREVFAMLRALKVDYEKVDENLGVLGRHIGNSSTQFNNVISSFQKIGKKLETTRQLDFEVEKKLTD
ncbi:MAG: DNA recombination protein RmuC [Candidatus Levybacteria bacterium]|nr:DNA recombination protein RmuC [Candidatus Levybacteria bacterium]